jgi:uncharacterized protein YbaR (Trm112 family)
MIDLADDILALLRCPVSGSRLERADGELLARLNAQIAAGQALTRLSEPLTEPVAAGLVNADRSLLYPIVSGQVVLLATEAIEIWELQDSA